MIGQGARNLVLVVNAAEPGNDELHDFHLRRLQSTACNVTKLKLSDFSAKSCENVVQKASQMGVVGGVFDFSQFKVSYSRAYIALFVFLIHFIKVPSVC